MKALLLEDDKDQADLVSATLLAIERAWDGLGRLVRLAPQGCEPQTVEYAPEDGAVASVSNGDAVATYLYDAARRDCGCAVALPNGAVMERLVSRDYYLDNPVISVRIVFAGETNRTLYVYDLAERPVARGTDSFAYSPRGEVVSAVVGGVAETHVYDGIGNSVSSANGVEFASFGANQLNQYEWVSRSGGTPETHAHTPDGSLSSHGLWSFSYDALSRLVTASVSGVCVQSNAYDHIGRRVVKATPGAVHTFFYDGWTPVLELVERAGGATDRIEYHWGKDMSGTFGGAGGVGGLLYVKVNGDVYVPFCDGFGNVTEYRDSSGAVVASYSYGAFGQTVSQSGPMAGSFAFRYSTKYWDEETGLYYYGRRFYSPELMRWMTRDPIEEEGGANLYAFCENNAVNGFDALGMNRYISQFDLLNYGGSGGTQLHVGVAVDTWECQNGRWFNTGILTFDFSPKVSLLNMVSSLFLLGKGQIDERRGLKLKAPITIKSSPKQDIAMLKMLRKDKEKPPFYQALFHNCIFWSVGAINYGM